MGVFNKGSLGKVAAGGVAAAALATVIGAGAASAADFTLKFATASTNDPMHEFMKVYEACLEPASNNRIDVQLYPSGQLGGVARMIEGIQFGTLEALFVAGQHMKGVEKRYGVVDAPGLFKSFDQANAAYWDPSFREPYLNAGKDKGVMGIAIFAYGPTSYQTVEPINTLKDFEGKKLRVLATEVETRLMKALGATGLQVDAPDLVPAMQRGQIDGVRSNIVLANALKFYTVGKNYLPTNEAMIPVVPYMSVQWFDKLPPDLQKAVLDCGRESEKKGAEIALQFHNNAEAKWKENGGTINHLPDADEAQLLAKAQEIGQDVFGNDPDLKPLYDALVAAAKKHSS